MAASSTVAFAQSPDFYISLGPSYSIPNTPEFDFTTSVDGQIESGAVIVDVEDNVGIEGSAGLYNDNWRISFVVTHNESTASMALGQGTGLFGQAAFASSAANYRQLKTTLEVARNFQNNTPVTPYLAVRGGANFIAYSAANSVSPPRFTTFASLDQITIDGSAFHASVIAGAEYELLDKISFFVQGEYGHTFGIISNGSGSVGVSVPCVSPTPGVPCNNIVPNIVISQFSISSKAGAGEFSAATGFRFRF